MQNTHGHQKCPSCHRPLKQVEHDRFRCEEHGEWVTYGPRLLVRAPQPEEHSLPRVLLPWETQTA